MGDTVTNNQPIPWTETPPPATTRSEGLLPDVQLGAGTQIASGGDGGPAVRLHLDATFLKSGLHWTPEPSGHIVLPVALLPTLEGNIGADQQSLGIGARIFAPLPDLLALYAGESLQIRHSSEGWTASGQLHLGVQAMISGRPRLLFFVDYSPPIPIIGTDEQLIESGLRFRL